jgi:hypothetical protein
MGMPQLVVTTVLVEGRAESEVARDYGVSRRWVITLVQRYLAEGHTGLRPRSRRPVRSPTRTADELEDEIVAIRKGLDRHGHEAGVPRNERCPETRVNGVSGHRTCVRGRHGTYAHASGRL